MEHEQFLKDLHKRLEIWDAHQRIGDILLEMVCREKRLKCNWNLFFFDFFSYIVFEKTCDRFIHIIHK